MQKNYNHTDYEAKIYAEWEAKGLFRAPTKEEAEADGQKPFTIIMPPPNANDPLHVGHAMFITIEDILIRYHRMKGDASLWLPGTDHAGIETQYVFEKKLNKQGKSRFNFDRDTLFKMIWDYVQENSGVAVEQMKRLGASADWSRFAFMLDPDKVDLVLSTFEKMHKERLIYRDKQLVNYCTKCGTSYSELEVVYEERNDPLYYLKYGPFELATVRPETKFGDTAVAVHPDDSRYQQWIGKEIEAEGLLGSFQIKVIADEHVDPEFGTGVVKVTPAHDPNDFAMGKTHQLEMKQVIGFNGKLNALTGPYEGLNVEQARKQIVADLKEKGLITKVNEGYIHNVGTCYRCGKVIEPLPMSQFFITVTPLAQAALQALDTGETKIYGTGFHKILRHWLTNLKDWNISRQIVWGIRFPVWYPIPQKAANGSNEELIVGFLDHDKQFIQGKVGELLERYPFEEIETGLQTLQAPEGAEYVVARTKPGKRYLQETDTFDTWFSSSQWPVSTLKTAEPGDFDYYYPTQVMETAYDILMFWVMRMMLMGIYLTGKSPFENVYLHGLVRDEKGKKMSKSKGNVINPLALVDKYGADALRMALVMSTTAGHDSAVGEQKVKGMRNFANKIWNACRYVTMMEADSKDGSKDEEFLEKVEAVAAEVSSELERMKIGLAAETVHNQFWHWFCDECIEQSKTGEISVKALKQGLDVFLHLLHPFMPFVTEACYKEVFHKEWLITSQWPK